MTQPQILRVLSLGHERWLADALATASSQRSELSALPLERLAQAVAEIEKIEAAGYPKPSLKRFLEARSPLFYGVFLMARLMRWGASRAFVCFLCGKQFIGAAQRGSLAFEMCSRFKLSRRISWRAL